MTQATAIEIHELSGTLKTASNGKLVIEVNVYYVGNLFVTGDVVTVFTEDTDVAATPGRSFRVDGKGTPFVRGYAKNSMQRRELTRQYLYVTDVTPAPATATETCAACGDATSQFCPMSEDGEGSHQLVARQPITAADAAFLAAVEIHHEQGAMER